MTTSSGRPRGVEDAEARAAGQGFAYSCEPPTGQLLAALAAAVPAGGRVLEIGTGCGVGTAWICSGLSGRMDVEVITIERDQALVDLVRASALWITVLHGDAEELLPQLGRSDLLFADAEGGKWSGLDLSLTALAPGGVLLVDDMELARYDSPAHRDAVTVVRETLLNDPRLVTAALDVGSGLMLSTRRP